MGRPSAFKSDEARAGRPANYDPDRSWSDIAALMIRNSSARPVNGHMKRTHMVYERKRPRHRANGVTPE